MKSRPALWPLLAILSACSPTTGRPPPGLAVAAPTAPDAADEVIDICVVLSDRLDRVPVEYVPATDDTLYGGRLFREAFPSTLPYAAQQRWYVDNDVLTIGGRRFVKFGMPRVLDPDDVKAVAEHRGVPIFAETERTGEIHVVYVPVRPGCEFQPYQDESHYRAIRGR